jgi:ribosomal protein S18 acetylase RimI-like enzyme
LPKAAAIPDSVVKLGKERSSAAVTERLSGSLASVGASGSTGPASPTIRQAQLQDLPWLAALIADSFHPPRGLQALVQPLFKLGIQQDLRQRLSARSSVCWVATTGTERGEAIAGTIELARHAGWPRRARGASSTYLSNLAVRPECRRHGIARQLLRCCERTTLEWGARDIYLHVLEGNPAARQLYESSGYRVCRREPDCSAWLLGRSRRLLLHKRL